MNIAFIDAQNLHLGTTKCNTCSKEKNVPFKDLSVSDCECGTAWKIDLFKFREYLRERYSIDEAHYFLGFLDESNQNLYSDLQKAGFIVFFREHNKKMLGTKKGNVDTDIVFEIMKNLIENKDLEKIVLVSGDGDYKKTVDYLVKKNKLKKILFPNGQNASSLYNNLDNSLKLSLSRKTVRQFIEYTGQA
jgi:uncharacterized LabA/DUF88 family protein